MTAEEFYKEITINVDLYWSNNIPHDQFTARQSELWRMIESNPETNDRVLFLIRESQKQAGVC